jgi:hypothetical protein
MAISSQQLNRYSLRFRSFAHFGCAKFYSRSHAVIPVYDQADNVTDTHEHAGDFNKMVKASLGFYLTKSA